MSAVTRALELSIVSEQAEAGPDGMLFSWHVWQAALRPILANNDVEVAPGEAVAAAADEGAEQGRPSAPMPNAVAAKGREIDAYTRTQHTTQQYFRFVVAQASIAYHAFRKHSERQQQQQEEHVALAAEEAWRRVSEDLFNERGPWGTGSAYAPTYANTNANASGSRGDADTSRQAALAPVTGGAAGAGAGAGGGGDRGTGASILRNLRSDVHQAQEGPSGHRPREQHQQGEHPSLQLQPQL